MFKRDVDVILARRHDNGADFWATPDRKLYVGNPFSTIGCLGILHELGVSLRHEAVQGAIALILDAACDDGRIRLGPKTPLYPCYTGEALRMLCRFGRVRHPAVKRTVAHLLETAHPDGGWRCDFTRFGRGPETRCTNPGATLYILDALRYTPALREGNRTVDRAVESLLNHWESRVPTGPCHWGIGTLFLQVEYPFLRYNLFFYTYVLSFFARARRDRRFREALSELQGRCDARGRLVVERPHRDLRDLEFCRKGEPSACASRRFRDIVGNLESGT
jgi:hypothetical protein